MLVYQRVPNILNPIGPHQIHGAWHVYSDSAGATLFVLGAQAVPRRFKVSTSFNLS